MSEKNGMIVAQNGEFEVMLMEGDKTVESRHCKTAAEAEQYLKSWRDGSYKLLNG